MTRTDELKKGDKVTSQFGGKTFKIGKIEKGSGGRYNLYNIRGKLMHVSGKSVKWVVHF